MKILVVTPVLLSELGDNIERLYASYKNLREAFNNDCIFLLVVQCENFNDIERQKNKIECKFGAEVIMTNVLNVSKSRNLGIIKSKEYKCSHVIFHDCSIFYPLNSCLFFSKYAQEDTTPKLKVDFSEKIEYSKHDVLDNDFSIKVVNINPIYDSYVWSYLFKVEKLNIYFDETIGPGNKTHYKSGEYVLFLFSYFLSIRSSEVKESNYLFVKHPPRPSDYSKHLLYAEGQGYLFRNLLFRYPSFRVVKGFLFFFANALFRTLIFRKNSLSILKLRLRGFFCKSPS